MNTIWLVIGGAAVVIILLGLILWRRRHPVRLKTEAFQAQWQELQAMLSDKQKWAEAVVSADKLLDTALKKRHISGRSMGARLVKAQRLFTDNDGVWFGHKLRNKIDADPKLKLKKADVRQALMGIRQALKDIGALSNGHAH